MANEDKPWLDAPIIRAAPEAAPQAAPPEYYRGAGRGRPRPPETSHLDEYVDTSVQQSPNAGAVLPLSNEPGRGLRLALPNTVRGLFTEGPQLNDQGQLVVPGATINPNTGNLGVTPEAQAAGSLFPASTPNVLMAGAGRRFVAPGTLDRRVELSPEFRANPTSAELPTRPAGPSSPTGLEPPPVSAVPAAGPPPNLKTSAGAKEVANYFYKQADEAGGVFTPQFTDSFIDGVTKNLPQTEAGRAVAGQSETAALAERLQALRGKNMTLEAMQEADEGLTSLISKEWGPQGISKDGVKLQQIQRDLRDRAMNAAEGDIEGGTAGVDALRNGRKAWSASMLLRDLEAIQERASRTEQPSTSIRTQVRTLLGNANKTRWYSPEEVAALEDAAQRGVLGGAFHVAGSRLVPMLAAVAGLGTSGPLGALIQGGAAGVLSAGARNIATTLQEGRLGKVADLVSRRVPSLPPNRMMGPGP